MFFKVADVCFKAILNFIDHADLLIVKPVLPFFEWFLILRFWKVKGWYVDDSDAAAEKFFLIGLIKCIGILIFVKFVPDVKMVFSHALIRSHDIFLCFVVFLQMVYFFLVVKVIRIFINSNHPNREQD